MTPEELAALFKRRGDFDNTRKNLFNEFQNSAVGKQFTKQLSDIIQKCVDEDPGLLRREKSEFHQLMVERITKSSEYKKVHQFADSQLQPSQYMGKIERTLMTIVKEQAPPTPEKEATIDQDKHKAKENNKGKEKDKDTDREKDRDKEKERDQKSTKKNHVAGTTNIKEEAGSPLSSQSSTFNSKQESSPYKKLPLPLPPTPSIKKEDSNNRPRYKDHRALRRELDLSLPPRPQPKKKEPSTAGTHTPATTIIGSNTTLAVATHDTKKEIGSKVPGLSSDASHPSISKQPSIESPKQGHAEKTQPNGMDTASDSLNIMTNGDINNIANSATKEGIDTESENVPTTDSAISAVSSTITVIPKKRNRRRSVASNSSLSSPPSSSGPESDGEGGERRGSRAKKLAKKAPREHDSNEAAGDSTATAAAVGDDRNTVKRHSSMENVEPSASAVDSEDTGASLNSMDIVEDPLASIDAAEAKALKPDNSKGDSNTETDEGIDIKRNEDFKNRPILTKDKDKIEAGTTTEVESSMDVDEDPPTTNGGAKEITPAMSGNSGTNESIAQSECKADISNSDSQKESTPNISLKSPVIPATGLSLHNTRSSPSPSSSSTPVSNRNSPAITGVSSNSSRKKESETTDNKKPLNSSSHSHSHGHHGSHNSKRSGHHHQPLPQRPAIVPLPPKPTVHASNRRTSNHARDGPSATTTGTGPSSSHGSKPSVGESASNGSLKSGFSSPSSSLPVLSISGHHKSAPVTSPTSSSNSVTSVVSSGTSGASPSTMTAKQDKNATVIPPPTTHVTTLSSSSSLPTSSSATSIAKPKPHVRTPIPLPHKPIPLPPKPNVAAGSGSIKKKHK
ncbi:hypothetical protein BX616_011042 [Lobosporangium transversale]|uniref:BOD1/SHG1 domain-containing protein n=1 Tax=Lobosporangium transversale TaxID=64571 RepID=A0A1Y2H2K9_9FUNG|nr:hypothetical protein BCR41DRAFT_418350 [Lobosporangium transversale]KAF9909842.1 hypothetical protein BX616_011042 [Lobosporangium transversale]ORZ28254.1 hypothetical protein BCR41DRAFT_418350 [Lobosporangium transversale]|eukprot:XP_021885939.1 hypothetical protein BCR41DRAFT_418350 [Lobosporangium transversale]